MAVLNGIDLVETERIRRTRERFGERFLQSVFTEREVAYCTARGAGSHLSLAARFAAKEAFAKALGTGIGAKAAFQEIEVESQPGGRPTIRLHGSALETWHGMGGTAIALSLSHTHAYAVASVVLTVAD